VAARTVIAAALRTICHEEEFQDPQDPEVLQARVLKLTEKEIMIWAVKR